MIELICEVCSSTFTVKPYRKQKARFCSYQCGGKWHLANRSMSDAHKFGNQYRKGLRPANGFTSEQVKGKRLVAYENLTCVNCGQSFERAPWEAKQNKGCCSLKCVHAHFRGENHPRYVGGAKTYRGRNWKKVRLLAVERDKGTCRKCGKFQGVSIPVHHIKPFRECLSAEEANKVDNLMCLCQSCHMKEEPPLARRV